MNEEPRQTSEFEDALRDSFAADTAQVGDVIEGTIAAIHGDVALVDISGKSEAVLARDELDDLGTGDPVEVVVVAVGDEIRVSRRLAIDRRLKEKLSQAASSGEPVEGKVVGRRKGGFDITVAGVRGFCPVSQIEDHRTDELDVYLGQTYQFKVLEYDSDGRKLVVSRAALLREEKERRREEAWSRLAEGVAVEGRVRSLTDFGAFVDLGGVDGLVHVTEISHGRVGHPREALAVGDQVTVKVLELDREKNRISLSLKQLQTDPWEGVGERYPARAQFEGRVVRKVDFGVFVELEPGLDGLVHVSQLPPGMELGAPEFAVGSDIRGWVREVDAEGRRIGLTLRQMPDRDPWQRVELRYQEGQVIEGTIENVADFGVFVEVEPGLSALIPMSELGIDRNQEPGSVFKPGEPVSAKILSVDPGRQRMSLSVKAFQRDRERAEYADHMDAHAAEPTVTGFGAALMSALETTKKPAKSTKKTTKKTAKKN
jgi:small subunit ribosomal protein S1